MNFMSRASKRFCSTSAKLSNIFEEQSRATFADRVSKLRPIRTKSKNAEDHSRRASVLVPLVMVDSTPSLLFTARSWTLNAHRGEICYPGGKFDEKHDTTLEDAALRETEEELGISRNLFKVWAKLPPLPSRDGKTGVTPIVAKLTEEYDPRMLKLNPDEVEHVFTRPISEFCRPDNQGFTQFRSGYTLPVYFWSPTSLKPKIWGLTAVITHQVLSALIPDFYQLKLQHLAKITSGKS